MGAGASAGVAAAVNAASPAVLAVLVEKMSLEERAKLVAALDRRSLSAAPQMPTADEILDSIRSGKQSCVAVMQSVFARIKEIDQRVNAVVELLESEALKHAAEVDLKVGSGSTLRSLEGLPILVKANIDVEGTLSTAATPALKDWRPRITAPCVQKLVEAGAIVIAKTNMPEMALRADGWNDLHGMVYNPHSLERSPGGSSSGTGAAIASGFAPVGLGSDTAGSLRLPGACCGVVGFRPSRGRWPCEGVVPIDSRRDTPGPMGSTVADVVLLDTVVTGDKQVEPAALDGICISVPQDWIDTFSSLDGTCLKGLEQAIAVLKRAGATVENKPEFLKVVKMLPGHSPMDSFADLQRYFDLHADKPEEVQADKVAEYTKNPIVKYVYSPPKDPEEHKAKLAELAAGIEKQEGAYREYFKEHGLQAILVPTMPVEPIAMSQTNPPNAMKALTTNAFFTATFNQLKVPSISLPTTVPLSVGGGSLSASVLLFGVDDRELLSIALSLERELRRP